MLYLLYFFHSHEKNNPHYFLHEINAIQSSNVLQILDHFMRDQQTAHYLMALASFKDFWSSQFSP